MKKVYYDFHIHSCLSPCAEDSMTPVTIVGFAKLAGLDMIAISDHNSIQNVGAALEAGAYYGVTVVPGIELQTAEDIHVLCLFRSLKGLTDFYKSITFTDMPNRKDIFGNQLIVDTNDEIVGEHPYYLLSASDISIDGVQDRAKAYGGFAIPAHIDRDSNGAVAILGDVPAGFNIVELSRNAGVRQEEEYKARFTVIMDSDAHTPGDIVKLGSIRLKDNSIDALFEFLEQDR